VEIKAIRIEAVKVEEIVDLRHRVLRAGLPRDAAIFPGDGDSTTVHLAAKNGEKIVGCATMRVNPWEGKPACQVRGMAVDPAYQGRGIGARLLVEAERIALGQGIYLIWANARTPASHFYVQNGWEVVSEMFEIPSAGPHYKMIRRLGKKSEHI
jgi:GNAT superfamily N-acetyltransferase